MYGEAETGVPGGNHQYSSSKLRLPQTRICPKENQNLGSESLAKVNKQENFPNNRIQNVSLNQF